jgi:ribonuclease BN (tRNA processing enzyme)
MKFQLLPSSFDDDGNASARQHLSCFVIDDCLAVDAGSLAMATNAVQKRKIRDVLLTHAHLDHIAGLPLFIDDLFANLEAPVQIHAAEEVIKILERDIFNWEIYPKFSELNNEYGAVMQYCPFRIGTKIKIKHLNVEAVEVNHQVSTVGFLISDDETKIAITGDTAEMKDFWIAVNLENSLDAFLIECAFPDELENLAKISHHLTPSSLRRELVNFKHRECPIYIINMKPMYREKIIKQIEDLKIENLHILEIGKVYEW